METQEHTEAAEEILAQIGNEKVTGDIVKAIFAYNLDSTELETDDFYDIVAYLHNRKIERTGAVIIDGTTIATYTHETI